MKINVSIIKGIIGAFLDTLIKMAVVALLVMYTIRFAHTAYDFGFRLFTEEPVSEAPGLDIKVTIPKGSNARDIGKILEERGLINDANLFFVQELISDYRGKLAAGTYTLNTSWTSEEMMKILSGSESSEEESAE